MDRETLLNRVAEAIYNSRHKGFRDIWPWDSEERDYESIGVRACVLDDANAALTAVELAMQEETPDAG